LVKDGWCHRKGVHDDIRRAIQGLEPEQGVTSLDWVREASKEGHASRWTWGSQEHSGFLSNVEDALHNINTILMETIDCSEK
jgi:hypothetical protein